MIPQPAQIFDAPNLAREIGVAVGNSINESLFGREAAQFAATARQSLLPFDSPEERRNIVEYVEHGLINGAGIMIAVVFIVAGIFLLRSEFLK